MKMQVRMYFECEHCGAYSWEWVPVSFHYSDGCYTVLKIDSRKCACESAPVAEDSARK